MGPFKELGVQITLPQGFLPQFLTALPSSVLLEVEGMETEGTVISPWRGQATVDLGVDISAPRASAQIPERDKVSLSGVCLFVNVRVDRACPSLSCCGLVTMTHKLTIMLCWTEETCLSPGWVMRLPM